MIDCIINKEKDDKYSDNMREEIKQEIKMLQSERENENEETVDNLCIKELGKYNNNEAIAELKKIWCFMD